MAKRVLLLIVATVAFGAAAGYFFGYDHGYESATLQSISSFEECAAAGYPIMESYPEQCSTPDGKHFTREVDLPEGEAQMPDEHPGLPLVPEEPVFCPMDARICPDGSYVGRTGPNCEFAPCPGE